MREERKENRIQKIKIICLLLIATLASVGLLKVFAAELEARNGIDIENRIGAIVKTYTATHTISQGEFDSAIEKTPFTALTTKRSIYCMQHGGRLFDNPEGILSRMHEPDVSMDGEINFKYGQTPSFKGSGKYLDYREKGETGTQAIDSNISFEKSHAYTLSITEAYAASFNGENDGDPWHNNSQYAIWRENITLYKAGLAVEALNNEIGAHGETPMVTAIRNENDPNMGCGTILVGNSYKVGPFEMSDYAYVNSSHVVNYSGQGIEKQEIVGGIVDGYITLNTGAIVNFDNITIEYVQEGDNNRNGGDIWNTPSNYNYPWPNSKFYIIVDRGACGVDATTLSSFTFKFRKTVSSGDGYYARGQYVFSTFDMQNAARSSCSYTCQDSTGSGNCSFSKSPGTSSSPYNSTCTHTWYENCYLDCHGHTSTSHSGCDHANGACSPSTTTTYCSGCHHEHGDSKSYTHTDPYLCGHSHEYCERFDWVGKLQVLDAQPLMGLREAKTIIYETEVVSYVDVRLTTDLTINKYITKVEHVGESIVTFGDTLERSRGAANSPNRPDSPNQVDAKRTNYVKAERGDKITYNIDIINNQDQDVSFQINDILPTQCTASTFNPSINGWLEVKANQVFKVVVTLRPTAETGLWENSSEIITKNSGSVDYNRTDYSPGDVRHNGPVVNVAELGDGPKGITKDSDFYKIKEFNVSIEKYIYDVEHNQDNIKISSIDTTLKATDERSVVRGMTEGTKRSNPVYVEYGDTVTYKIKVYNTTSSSGSRFDVGRDSDPYWTPDKVYVNIEDTLPKKYSKLDIQVSGTGVTGNNSHIISKTDASTNGGTFTIKDLMVPAGGVRIVTVTLTVDEYTKGTIEENNVKFIGTMKNINRGPNRGDNSVPDNLCVIKNNSSNLNTSDWYILNDYDAFMDKYVYKYDEKIEKENNSNTFTNGGFITNADGTLKTSRERKSDKEKQEKPVSAEKYETLIYAIKVTNEAKAKGAGIPSGNKPATQVRTTEVKDYMQIGLTQKNVEAKMYNADGSICTRYSSTGNVAVNVSAPTVEGKYNTYRYRIGNETILNPGEFIIYYVTVEITESNMYLYDLENKAELTVLTNINNTDKDTREIKNPSHNENISKQQISSEFVRMKDLVIAGNVWVDFDRDGFMQDTANETQQKYYNLNSDARKKDVVVHLYQSDGTLLRTTKTDANGLYTFGRDLNLGWYKEYYNHDTGFSSGTMYQRIDKATNKDGNGNYTTSSQILSYYIEYEYDGVLYKSTEFYAGTDGKKHLKEEGSYEPEYLIDSNAAEFKDVREQFNTQYEYISYNVAYDLGLNKTNDMVYDKVNHKSELMEDNSRLMTSRSFINVPSNKNDANSTNYLWLFQFGSMGNEKPETDYLKHINLGLELREDADIALTKDVYKVKTTIDGEEMEYNFNQNNGLNGDMGFAENYSQGAYLQDYIIGKPYGLELYESDYKYRFEQYKAAAVRKYKGLNGESELNVEVTYRITLDNKSVTDDDTVREGRGENQPDVTDTKLDVKVHEVLDLYDANFIKYTEDVAKDFITVKTKDAEGFLVDKKINIAEAWYFKPAGSGATGTRYSVDTAAGGAKPIFKEDPNGNYVKVDLTLSNTSSRGPKGKFSEKANDFTADGYNTVYITGMGDEIIHEGENLDIYVKYVIDKEALEVGITNENYEETVSTSESTNTNKSGSTSITETEGTTTKVTSKVLERSLKIAERTTSAYKEKYGRGTENIAQVNAYSVWYTDGKPASLVDMDSNPGNIGVKNDSTGVIPGEAGYSESLTSADNVEYYEDTTYKTGIEIVADATENTKEKIEEKYKKIQIVVELQGTPKIIRSISGMVWDDSRTDTLGTGGDEQYIGDGLYDTEEIKNNLGKENESVKLHYKDESVSEEKDIKVRNARAEFIEIVQVDPTHYYEEILSDVTWEQVQHIRTDTDGKYELIGFVPGKYIVRFTYGDTVEENKASATYDATLEAQNDMLIFNGQDYKSTQYTNELSDNETDVDEIIRKLEVADRNDGRDDEVRRLEVNRFSEVMTNELAEILKGVANGTKLTERSDKNNADQLEILTDNTYMEAETVEFLVKAEKLTDTQTPKYIFKQDVNSGNKEDAEAIARDIYYRELERIHYADTNTRDFKIENVDFGIEYRPESQISLAKEIDEVKITTEDGNTLIDLFFYTTGEQEATVHHIDTEKSTGLDLIQFISNDYTALLKDLTTEDTQGFIYIQVDDDILQGSKIDIMYKFKANNESEIDRITTNLNDIRYKENKATQDLVAEYNGKGVNIIDTNYTASGTARNMVYADMFAFDENSDLYRNRTKTITDVANGKTGYYGTYVGYAYYTGEETALDTVSSLKFDKILDYVDTDLEFDQETNNNNLEDKYWSKSTASELVNYVYTLKGLRNTKAMPGTSIVSDNGVKLINVQGMEYTNLVVSVDDRRVDIGDENDKYIVNNQDLSRFLLPAVTDETENLYESRGIVYLPVSKVVSAETSTDNMSYENIAEIIQFTTLTGRRTNFATTIGNANVNTTPDDPTKGSKEFITSSFEPDTAATETITLTPPTGMMKNRRVIVNAVETAKVSVGVIVIAVAVVIIAIFVTKTIITKIKKRRYK